MRNEPVKNGKRKHFRISKVMRMQRGLIEIMRMRRRDGADTMLLHKKLTLASLDPIEFAKRELYIAEYKRYTGSM